MKGGVRWASGRELRRHRRPHAAWLPACEVPRTGGPQTEGGSAPQGLRERNRESLLVAVGFRFGAVCSRLTPW